MTNRTAIMPRPPSRLWGLWCVSEERPEGYWLSHTHAQDTGDAPMTFLRRDDALTVAGMERAQDGWYAEARAELLGCERETPPSITVALIGVAPPE